MERDTDLVEVLLDTEKVRLLAPSAGTVPVVVTGHPGIDKVEVKIRLDGRRYVVTDLHVSGDGIKFTEIQRLPLSRWLRDSLASAMIAEVDGKSYTADEPLPDADPAHMVATIYSVALALGENPTAQVADRLDISNDAAAQRVRRARQRGYLPPTTAGRAS